MAVLKHRRIRIDYRRGTNKRKYPTGREQLHAWCEQRREIGVGSWEAGALLSNASQYAGDAVAAGIPLAYVQERPPHGGRASKGVRWFLPEYAPEDALMVTPTVRDRHAEARRHELAAVPEPAPARKPRKKSDAPSDIGDLFELAPPISVSHDENHDQKAA